jgi:TrmH RNA methyltransferase
MEYMDFRTVRDTALFLKALSKRVITIGTDLRARERIRDLPLILRAEAEKMGLPAGRRPPVALVLGNEEMGLTREAKEACRILMRVPGTGLVESLNVAEAATLFMQELYELKI